MELTPEMLERLKQLEEKYAVMGQDMPSYLDGLLYADYLTYWDYIHLDTLLSLQTPRTPLPDEEIFIMYHQITELYFKLSLLALHQVTQEAPPADLLKRQLRRLNQYFEQLIHSFDIMIEGMDKEEFLKFRMSLLPASGFQSAQYREIEIWSTDLYRLVHVGHRAEAGPDTPVARLYPWLYWKWGATELATGRKTLTLRQFEEKYSRHFIQLAGQARGCNLWRRYQQLSAEERSDPALIDLLKTYDFNANVRWRLSHLHAAARYLHNQPKVIEATGGTNWQHYLPPHRQRIIFFPELWAAGELDTWGKKPAFNTDE